MGGKRRKRAGEHDKASEVKEPLEDRAKLQRHKLHNGEGHVIARVQIKDNAIWAQKGVGGRPFASS